MKWRDYIFPVFGYVIWLVGCCLRCPQVYGWWTAAIIAGAVLAFPLSVVLHEFGHMLFGALVKIKAVPSFKIFGSSSCKIIPKTDKNLKRRIIFTALGGLIVNFALVVFSIIAMIDAVGLPFWASVFFPSCWYLTALNALPYTYGEGKTDVAVICELVQDEPSSKVMLAVLTVQARVLNGTPIEQIDKELLFGVPQIQEDDPAFISLTELRYEYFKAKGEEEQAEKFKTRFEELKKEYM